MDADKFKEAIDYIFKDGPRRKAYLVVDITDKKDDALKKAVLSVSDTVKWLNDGAVILFSNNDVSDFISIFTELTGRKAFIIDLYSSIGAGPNEYTDFMLQESVKI